MGAASIAPVLEMEVLFVLFDSGPDGANLQGPDLGKLAALVDIPYFKCSSGETFSATVAKPLASKGLTMVEVVMNAVDEFSPWQSFNQW